MTMATTGEQRAQVIYAQAQAVAAHWRTMGMEPSAGSIQAATLDQITAHVARCEELAARYRVTMGKRGKKALEARYGTEVAADIIARNKAGRRS